MKTIPFSWPAAALLLLGSIGIAGSVRAQATASEPPTLAGALRAELRNYLSENAAREHISAASLSVLLRGETSTIDVAAGTTSVGGSSAVTPANIFQIGSNTKAFTAVALLHLERAGKLTVHQTVGQWLPQYPQWKSVTIAQLLSMTSGIATYDSTAAWEKAVVANPYYDFPPAQLIGYVDPNKPLAHGWLYSNTGYLLAQLIVEKASGESYTQYLGGIIAQAGLHDTFYQPSFYPEPVYARIVDGYYDNTDPGNEGLAKLLGVNVRPYSLSWTQAAGGIVATPSDVAKWARNLYAGPILTTSERAELESLVSSKTGKPIARTSASEPSGFGLGVSQVTRAPLGTFWFYEGETLGYRVAHIYVPATDTVIAVGLNSQASPSVDGIGPLLARIYKILQANGRV